MRGMPIVPRRARGRGHRHVESDRGRALLCRHRRRQFGRRYASSLFQRRERGVVVRFVGHLGNDLLMDDGAVRIEHVHGSREQLQLLDQGSPTGAERPLLVVAGNADVGDVGTAAEARLRERQIATHRNRVDLALQRREVGVEAARLRRAHRRVQRRHHAYQARLALQVGERDLLHAVVEKVQREIGRRLPQPPAVSPASVIGLPLNVISPLRAIVEISFGKFPAARSILKPLARVHESPRPTTAPLSARHIAETWTRGHVEPN